MHRTCIHDVDHLKTRLVEEWQMFEQKIIDCRVIKQWRPCLRAWGREQGGHFEHHLYPELAWLTACHWLYVLYCAVLETLCFERCNLNFYKINSCFVHLYQKYFCKLALLFVWLKFQTNLTSLCWIIATSLRVGFLSGHSVHDISYNFSYSFSFRENFVLAIFSVLMLFYTVYKIIHMILYHNLDYCRPIYKFFHCHIFK